MSDLVRNWFGDRYSELHPLLQKLYSEGGALNGSVELSYGKGVAGLLGRRWAAKQGLGHPGKFDFQLRVCEQDGLFTWDRQIGNVQILSHFCPSGTITDGHWYETVGSLTLFLGVEIIEGGWYWRIKKVKFSFLRLPLFLFPKMTAFKTVRSDLYVFKVCFSYPLLGKLFSYEGELKNG